MTASDLVAMAAFKEGHHAQAFPSFGSERTGAPVVSYCRVDDKQIRTREPVQEPDIVIVQDPTLLAVMDVFAGLKPGGYVLINSSKTPEELELDDVVARTGAEHITTVPASEIARAILGRPLPNAALLGAMSALTELVDLSSVEEAIKDRFHGKLGESNSAAARAAYDFVKESADAEAN